MAVASFLLPVWEAATAKVYSIFLFLATKNFLANLDKMLYIYLREKHAVPLEGVQRLGGRRGK